MDDPVATPGSSIASPHRTAEPSGASRAPAIRGPETVINPERRVPPAPSTVTPATPATPRSSIVRLLFPAGEGEPADGEFHADKGVQLGHFSILERIRTGGMGAVFKALDTRLNRVVALKVLPPAMTRDPLIVQRFQNEAQAAAQLDHENIARVYYIGEDQGLHFIAFEFVTGTNVRELIHQHGRLPVSETINYALQIASALVHTASQSVVHRDIKPSNIIIGPGGRAKLVDLGLARKENKDAAAVELTMAGTTLGTFDYISPEQARDPRSADTRSDIYSLGCTVYHMLTGEPPFPEGTVLQKLLQHQGDEAPDPALKNRDVPESLSTVVRKMMAKDPRRRYQTAELLLRDLMLVAGSLGLRSVSPEGLVWLSAQTPRAPFWERNLAWMTMVGALLIIVGYLEFSANRNLRHTPDAGAVAQGGSPQRTRRAADVESTATPIPDAGEAHAGSGNAAAGAAGTVAPPQSTSTETADTVRRAPNDGTVSTDPQTTGTSAASAGTTSRTARVALGPPALSAGLSGTLRNSVSLLPELDSIRVSADAPVAEVGGAFSIGPSDAIAARSPTRASPDAATRSTVDSGTAPETTFPAAKSGTERPATAAPAAVEVQETGIFVVNRNGQQEKRLSLEAACAAATIDGTVIELRFDGRRIEAPVRITKKVTIRAGRGFRPVVEFRSPQRLTETTPFRAISLTGGSLDLSGVDIVLPVDETADAELWTVFATERAEALHLHGCTVTVQNPRQRPATVVELRSSPAAMMPEMTNAVVQPRSPFEVEMTESIVRGEADLILIKNVEPARLSLKQTALALQGTLLSGRGHSEFTQDNAQWELRLEFVTAVLGNGLVRLDSGTSPRKLLPVQVNATNNIISSSTGAPLIAMTGAAPTQDFRLLLTWNGQNNFYDHFQTFWSVISLEGTGKTEDWKFSDWMRHWPSGSEIGPTQDAVVWRKRHWLVKPMSEIQVGDFALDREDPLNLAVRGATNSSDAGANLANLPRPAPPATEAAEAAAPRFRERE
jgi:eukaryotic-like serine/threonine-protein kinase